MLGEENPEIPAIAQDTWVANLRYHEANLRDTLDDFSAVREVNLRLLKALGPDQMNHSKQDYPEAMRRVVYRDAETHKRFVFLTNNFALPALTIAQLYKARWHVELFFKWIKQHLRIKAFSGTSENSVKTQIWIAVCVYVLVAIVKKRLGLNHSLYTILQILSIGLFEKTPVLQAFSQHGATNKTDDYCNQLQLFNF